LLTSTSTRPCSAIAPDQLGRPVGGREVDGHGRHTIEPVEAVGSPGAGDDVRGFVDESFGDRQPNALPPSGHDGDFVGKCEVHGCSSWIT
jgi:hypothetical protein